jgi:hypothetical protein
MFKVIETDVGYLLPLDGLLLRVNLVDLLGHGGVQLHPRRFLEVQGIRALGLHSRSNYDVGNII